MAFQELPRLADLICRYRKRSKTRFPWQYHENFAGSTLRGLQLIGAESRMAGRLETSTVGEKVGKVQPVVQGSSASRFPYWPKWVVGCVLSLFFPFWKLKWAKLLMIEAEVETVVEEAENVAEALEKAAIATEKASAQVVENLPDNSKLKEAALLVERVSKETAKDAHLTRDLLHKVDEIKEDLETLVKPLLSDSTKNESAST